MGNITKVDTSYSGGVAIAEEVVCLNCKNRWEHTFRATSYENGKEKFWQHTLKDIVCPICNEKGFVIITGEAALNNQIWKMGC